MFSEQIFKETANISVMVPIMNALLMLIVFVLHGVINGERPAVVNIGAVLTYDSAIGRVAKAAIEAAVHDVNANENVLNGTRLNLIMEDSSCSAFIGAVEGITFTILFLYIYFFGHIGNVMACHRVWNNMKGWGELVNLELIKQS